MNLSELELAVIEAIDNEDFEALEALENTALNLDDKASAVIESHKIEFKAKKVKNIILDIQMNVALRMNEITIDSERETIALEVEQSEQAITRKVNRLKRAEKFTKSSKKALEMIAQVSSAETVESLLNCSNMKTATRIRYLAEYLADSNVLQSNTSSIVKQSIDAINATCKRYQSKSFTLKEYTTISNKDKSFTRNQLIALTLFKFVECSKDVLTIESMSAKTIRIDDNVRFTIAK